MVLLAIRDQLAHGPSLGPEVWPKLWLAPSSRHRPCDQVGDVIMTVCTDTIVPKVISAPQAKAHASSIAQHSLKAK